MDVPRTAVHVLAAGALAASAVAVVATAATANDGGRTYTVAMTGAQEISGTTGAPNAGDPDGSGTGSITVNVGQGTVCWSFTVANVDAPTRGHIHRAPAGSNGGIVVTFFEANNVAMSGCTTAPRPLLRELLVAPERFYLNLHNAAFPAGALRGQLAR